MTRTRLLLTLLLLALTGGPPGRPGADARVGDRPPGGRAAVPAAPAAAAATRILDVLEARACKPRAPVDATLDVRAVPGAVDLLVLRVQLRPVLDLAELTWRLELPPGVLAAGPVSGAAEPRAGATTELVLHADVLGEPRGELALVVEGRLPGDDAVRTVVGARRAVRLGDAPSSRPDRTLVDAATGARTRVASLPVRHRTGR